MCVGGDTLCDMCLGGTLCVICVRGALSTVKYGMAAGHQVCAFVWGGGGWVWECKPKRISTTYLCRSMQLICFS